MYDYRSVNEADTERLAHALAEMFIPGSVLALDGDLGAGKTRFSQAVGRAIGVKGIVNSPTFTIIKEYEGTSLPLYHMDVYRISTEEADELGLDEYFYGDGVTLIEWASRITDLLPEERLQLFIHYIDETERKIELTPHGERYETWCESLQESGVIQSGDDS